VHRAVIIVVVVVVVLGHSILFHCKHRQKMIGFER